MKPITQWSPASKFFHWTTVVMVLALFILGWLAVNYPLSPTKIRLFNWHKSLGLLLLAWTVARLLWRLATPAPPLPADMPKWQLMAARLSHGGLYLILLTMPVVGWIINSAGNFPLRWFGLFQVPAIAPESERLQAIAENVHLAMFWILSAILLTHVSAACYHHWVRRDDLLKRMLPFVRVENK